MQTEFRSLYEITGKITDHNMLVVPAAKLKALTLYEKLAEEYGLSIFPDLEALAAEIALLRTGYAASRLEIESLQDRIKTMAEEHADELMVAHLDGRMRAAQPAGVQQPGTAYAAQMAAEVISKAAPQQEPVAWQSRMRPTWGSNTVQWSPWENCTKGQAEDYWKTPVLNEWAYEARALYTEPQPSPAAQEGK